MEYDSVKSGYILNIYKVQSALGNQAQQNVHNLVGHKSTKKYSSDALQDGLKSKNNFNSC